jgi:hypothetical protein
MVHCCFLLDFKRASWGVTYTEFDHRPARTSCEPTLISQRTRSNVHFRRCHLDKQALQSKAHAPTFWNPRVHHH